ncbi:hypothetical protein PM082_002173 [Marasmius tenuissimus]|nr:hypothetical protein PM082_002173 [Marasmius tenuissimus]
MNFATIFRGRRKASKPKNDPNNLQRIDQDVPMDSLKVTGSLKDAQHAAQDVPVDDDPEMTDSFEDSLEDAQRVVQDVLNDEDKYRKIIEAKGGDAQKCLDLLQLLAERSTTSLQSSMLKMMLRLLEHSSLYPQCLVVKDVKRPSGRPAGGGSFGDVYKGVIGGQTVCLKLPRIFEDTEDPDADKLIKEYMREAIVWRQLNHPNLLPFIGVYYLDEAPNQLCLISPWMERGDLTRYLKSAQKQNADVDRLLLAYDVAAGLSYLHSKKIVHGDLKGPNVLINADGRALIGDFGLSRVVETHTPGLFNSTTGAKGTIRWLSPELLKSNPPCRMSERSDIYAYAGVCYEIFTGKQPFYKLHDMAIFDAVVIREERPDRPDEARELSDSIWDIMVSCWHYDQQLRPSAGDVFARIGELKNPKTGAAVRTRSAPDSSSLSHGQIWLDVKCPPIDTAVFHRLLSEQKITPSIHGPHNTEIRFDGKVKRIDAILRDGEKCRKVLGARADEAQRYLDLFYALLDYPGISSQSQSTILELVLRLSKRSGMHPKCLKISGVARSGGRPVESDAFENVWKGAYEGNIVRVKVVTVFPDSNVPRLFEDYMQEAIVWSRLKHPSLLPFMGICYLNEDSYMCTVSPWMQRGNLVQFLKSTPGEHVDHLSLASGVASGIAYLHHANIVHGDLKGVKILITPDLKPCIGGFEWTQIAKSVFDSKDGDDKGGKGTLRWMAPERLSGNSFHGVTARTDMYAYGCVCYEIFTRRTPFYDLPDGAVTIAVLIRHQHPSRPADLNIDDRIWEFITSFWNHDPSLRPTAADAIDRIQHLANSMGRGNIQDTPDWSWFDVEKKRRGNVEYPPLDLELLFQI